MEQKRYAKCTTPQVILFIVSWDCFSSLFSKFKVGHPDFPLLKWKHFILVKAFLPNLRTMSGCWCSTVNLSNVLEGVLQNYHRAWCFLLN